MSPEERAQLKQEMESYQDIPDDAIAEIEKTVKAMSPEDRAKLQQQAKEYLNEQYGLKTDDL